MIPSKLAEIELIFNASYKKARRYKLTLKEGWVSFPAGVRISRQKQRYLKDLLRAGTNAGEPIVLLDTRNIRLP